MKDHNQRNIKQAIEELLKTYKLKEGLNEARLKNSWERLVGPLIANHTKDIRIHKKILYITLDSAALRQELLYGKEKLVDLLNESAGEKMVEDIVLK
jgi:predicted nucleic acid-binding Zn ribbon protein